MCRRNSHDILQFEDRGYNMQLYRPIFTLSFYELERWLFYFPTHIWQSETPTIFFVIK